MRILITALLALCLGFPTFAPLQAQDTASEAAEPESWLGYTLVPAGPPDRIEVEQSDAGDVLVVSRTGVMLEGVEFAQGVIEFDIAFDSRRGFGGLVWHAKDDGSQEYFYIRQHKSGMPDAGQYTPVRNGLTSWQLYTDRDGIAPIGFAHQGWNRFRMVVVGDAAEIFFNGGAEPVIHIPDLAADNGSGGVGFRASGPNGQIRIRNLAIRDLAPEDALIGASASERVAPQGVIDRWAVSQVFAETAVTEALQLPDTLPQRGSAGVVAIDRSGIADLSRVVAPTEDARSVLVSTTITSDSARRVRMTFGYSDRVRLFLNGQLVFDGVAGWRSRDFFFLGTVGFEDAVVLDLEQGANTLTAAVGETFGGWAFAGAIADREGLSISPQ